jgi:glucose/arabinose dehydrogenase
MRIHGLVAGLALLAASLPAVAGTPPPGFTDTLVTNDVSQPTAIAFLPDGTLLVTEKTGALKEMSGGVATTLVNIPVCTGSEMGLLGIAIDPNFATNGFIYLYRTKQAPGGCGTSTGRFNQVVRVTMSGGTVAIGSLVELLTGIRTDNGNHDGGGLRIGPDQKLYVGVGDTGLGDNVGGPGSASNPYAQDLNELEGKVLRLELDGTPAAGNPFIGMAGKREEIFAYGFRNPFRFGFDPSTGRLWLGDVGDLTFEEIDVVTSGDNYSWPYCEGVQPGGCAMPGDVAPVFTYPHSGGGALGSTVIGGAFAPAGFGGLDTHYFFADYIASNVYRAPLNGPRDDFASAPVTFVSDADGPVDVIFGPDGALYYVAIFSGEVRRVAPAVVGPSEDLITGKKLVLRDNPNPMRRNATLKSNEHVGLGGGNGSSDDPTLNGGSLRIVSGSFDDTYPLPTGGWTITGAPGQNRGYLYRDRPRANGPFTQVRINAGHFIAAAGRGPALGHTLATNPDPVSVVLTIGNHRYCMTYGGTVDFLADKRFRALDAPTAASCPP